MVPPVHASHTCMVPCEEPETMRVPSGENAMHLIAAFVFHIPMAAVCLPMCRCCPFHIYQLLCPSPVVLVHEAASRAERQSGDVDMRSAA
jgi:hypothetical protein